MSGDERFFKTLGIAAVSEGFSKKNSMIPSLILNQEAVKVFFGESNRLVKKL